MVFSIPISYITNEYLTVILPWGINTLLVAGVFFLVGYLIKKNEILEKGSNILYIIISIVLLFIGVLSTLLNYKTVSYIDYNYGSLTLAFISGISLSLVIIYFSKLISTNKYLEYIGKNTMGILIFHKIVILVFQTKLGIISRLLKSSNLFVELMLTIVITVLSIVCSLIATEITKRICPFLLGESKKVKNV